MDLLGALLIWRPSFYVVRRNVVNHWLIILLSCSLYARLRDTSVQKKEQICYNSSQCWNQTWLHRVLRSTATSAHLARLRIVTVWYELHVLLNPERLCWRSSVNSLSDLDTAEEPMLNQTPAVTSSVFTSECESRIVQVHHLQSDQCRSVWQGWHWWRSIEKC